ncbi:MAG: DUF169 domain-containing protein [Candidatus Bathyarchaeota archaeon]|nr:MAG: DUF169 domain-containing protein [Candidatus Bathyarchaeota archaeon]
MADSSEQYDHLKQLLSFKTHPVAVRYLPSIDEELEWELVEEGFYRPRHPLNVCQLVGIARHQGRKVFSTPEDSACNIGTMAVGFHPFDEAMSSGEIGVWDGVRRDSALCREMFQTLPRIEYGTVRAVAVAPLDKMNLDIDQVVFYGNPLDILKIFQAYLWGNAPRLEISTAGKYGVCIEGMASSYLSRRPSVGFPCRGERVSSIVQDDEMFICIPGGQLEAVIEGLEETKHLLPRPMPFGGVDQPPYFLPDYYLTEAAKKKMYPEGGAH